MSKKLPRIKVSCKSCEKEFETNQSTIDRGRGKFCSRSCSARFNSVKHGHARDGKTSRTYTTWATMVARCHSPSSTKFPQYGLAGISVCEEWRDFKAFHMDMGDRPDGMTIDRIDGTKGYSKDNCRWATIYEQQNNIKSNRAIIFEGRSYTVPQLSRHIGVSSCTLRYRIKKGFSDDQLRIKPRYGNRISVKK